MTNGTVQTAAIFLIYVVDFLILVCLKPFSNSVIQCFTTMTVSLFVRCILYEGCIRLRFSQGKEQEARAPSSASRIHIYIYIYC